MLCMVAVIEIEPGFNLMSVMFKVVTFMFDFSRQEVMHRVFPRDLSAFVEAKLLPSNCGC